MKISIMSSLLFCLASVHGLAFSNIVKAEDASLERQLYNRNAHVILQEPIERAQKRADDHAAKVKRGDYKPPHHPKYRPTGTYVPPLETGTWNKLALIRRKMEEDALDQKVEAHEARAVREELEKREAEAEAEPMAAPTPTGFEVVYRR